MLTIKLFQVASFLFIITFLLWILFVFIQLIINKPKITMTPICISLGVLLYSIAIIYVSGTNTPQMEELYYSLLNLDPVKNAKIIQTTETHNFELNLYELGRENFNGNCYGITTFVRESFLKKTPRKLFLSKKEEAALYPSVSPWKVDKFINHYGIYKNISLSRFLEMKQTVRMQTLGDKFVNNKLIDDIQQYQSINKFRGAVVYSFSQNRLREGLWQWFVLVFLNRGPVSYSVDIEWIQEQLNSGKPVIIGLMRDNCGHALLCYKALEYSNGVMRLYVMDPNIVYQRYSQTDLAAETYITLGKIGWQDYFIYNPCINGNYIYQGQYTSAMPNSALGWY